MPKVETREGFFKRTFFSGEATADAIDALCDYFFIARAVEGKRGRNPIPVAHYHSGNGTDVDLVIRCALLAKCAITQ